MRMTTPFTDQRSAIHRPSIPTNRYWLNSRLYATAQELNKHQKWRLYLSPQELCILQTALTNREHWDALMHFTLSSSILESSIKATPAIIDSTVEAVEAVEAVVITTDTEQHGVPITNDELASTHVDQPESTPNIQPVTLEKKEQKDLNISMIATACRVRQVLFDQMISEIMPSYTCCEPIVPPPFHLLGSELDEKEEEEEEETSELPVVPPQPRLRIADEDFDFDEEEEEEGGGGTKANGEENKPEINKQNSSNLETEAKKEDTKEPLAKQDKDLVLDSERPYYRYFFTFEEDAQASRKIEQEELLLKQQQKQQQLLERSPSLLDELPDIDVDEFQVIRADSVEAMNDAHSDTHHTSKLMAIFGTVGIANMTHLLTSIESHRDNIPFTDNELRSILRDVRPRRSKWASDDRVNQEELYDAFEHVLDQLKNYRPHSVPFLTKVSRRDAPDYYQVITHPMDLGTMTKKLKEIKYQSKQEFMDDVMLIYKNCIDYNTEPGNVYRKSAQMMQKKTDRLALLIPDLQIKDRAQVEAEEELEENNDVTGPLTNHTNNNDTLVNIPDLIGTPASPTPQPQSTALTRPLIEDNVATLISPLGIDGGQDIEMALTPNDISTPINVPYHSVSVGGKSGGKTTMDMNGIVITSESPKSIGLTRPVDMTLDTATDTPVLLHDMGTKRMMAIEMESLLEEQAEMETERLEDNEDNEDNELEEDVITTSWRNSTLEKRSQFERNRRQIIRRPFMEQTVLTRSAQSMGQFMKWIEHHDQSNYQLDCGMPLTYQPYYNTTEYTTKIKPRLSQYTSAVMPQDGLIVPIDESIHELRHIRQLHEAMLPFSEEGEGPASNMGTLGGIDDTMDTRMESTTKQNVLQDQTLSNSNQETAFSLLAHVSAKLAAHSGFEVISEEALCVLTESAANYFSNIGRLLRNYMDIYTKEMSSESGIDGPNTLALYISEQIQRNASKLGDIGRRLATTHQELVSAVEGSDSVLMDIDAEQFTMGDIFNEFEDDYLGLRELGLESELHLPSLKASIPSLINGSDHGSHLALPFPPPPLFAPLSSTQNQIGILHSFLNRKLSEYPSIIIEDEFMPKTKKKPARKRAVARITTATTPIMGGVHMTTNTATTSVNTTTVVSVMNEGSITPQKKKSKMSHDMASPLPSSTNTPQHLGLISPTLGSMNVTAEVTTPMDTPMSEVLASPTPVPSDRGDANGEDDEDEDEDEE
ncbi:hypothetical protein BDF19DRAFT_419751 [Syncephalis fuscata]|nr:hypothetical protein BDF19DRAFT_419751 [Syncephalis fuscata]